jgi:hypothetical protein
VMRVSKCSEEIFNVRRKNYFLRTFHGVSMWFIEKYFWHNFKELPKAIKPISAPPLENFLTHYINFLAACAINSSCFCSPTTSTIKINQRICMDNDDDPHRFALSITCFYYFIHTSSPTLYWLTFSLLRISP